MFTINGIDRLFYPEITPLFIDPESSFALLGRGFKVQKLPKGCFDGESDPIF